MDALGKQALVVLLVLVGCDGSSPGDADAGGRDAARGDASAPSDGAPDNDGGTASDGGTTPAPGPGCPSDIASDPDVGQALPVIDFDTSMPAMTGTVRSVPAGGDLQAAIDAAQPGDVIELDPTGTWQGPFTLPEKSGDGWIVIRSAAPDAMFAEPGVRVDPSRAAAMPDLVVAPGVGGVFETEGAAHHYRLIGLEMAPTPGSFVYALVSFGGGATSVDELPHHLVIDRCYLRADPTAGTRRGLALNSGAAAVLDSWFAGFFEIGADSQAIAGWSGSGPYRIINNHLEGASENVMFGGSDPSIPDVLPSDIEICGNHFTKPIEWYGMGRAVKNLFELKNARRVLVAGNVFEHCWADAQVGFAIVFTPRNQDGSAPWSTIEDVTFVRNVVTRTAGAMNILGSDYTFPSGQQRRIVVRDNLVEVDPNQFEGIARVFQIIAGPEPVQDLLIAHNTVRSVDSALVLMGDSTPVSDGLVFRDNVATPGGVYGSGTAEGLGTLDHYAPGYEFRGNVLVGYDSGRYPADNFFPTADVDVGFVDASGGDYRLAPSSPYAGAATDGTDPGADFELLDEAIRGVM